MSLRSLVVALALAWALPISAQTSAVAQTVLYPGLEGEALLSAIRADYAPTGVLSYDDVRDELFAWEDDETGGVRGVYTGFTITLTPGADPSTSAFLQGIDTEHTWPQSRGTMSGPARSDGHHLFPAKSNVNSSRGNDPLAEIPDVQTDTWYRLDQVLTTQPTEFLDEWSETDGGRFEPREDHGGNAARAMFYIEAIYGSTLQAGFFDLQYDDLLDWHYQDAVDAYEADRSSFIALLQGNENPFILDSTLARRAFTGDGGPGGSGEGLIISEYVEGSSFNKAVELYNPTTEAIDLAGYTLQVFFNGNTGAGTTVTLAGSVAPGEVFVVASSSADPAILAVTNQTTSASLFNGNDAVVLFQGANVADAIGQVGFDPGEEWGTGLTSTKDNTLRRKADDCTADTLSGDAFDPAERYDGFATNDFADLGMASLACESTPVVVAEIEPVGAPIIVPVSGGSLSYRVTLTNTTSTAQTFTAEVTAALPNGAPFGPIQGPQTVRLPAGASAGPITFTENVPGAAPAGTYTVTLALSMGGETFSADSFTFDKASAREGGDVSARTGETTLLSPYPNPARGLAHIGLILPNTEEVRLSVYDVTGREVARLADGALPAGKHEFALDGSGLPSGVYLVRLQSSGTLKTERVTVLQ